MAKVEKSKFLKECIEWTKCIVLGVLCVLFVMKFIFFVAKVPSSSMVPTIEKGDRIIVCRFFMYFDWENRGLTYGDLVVFYFEDKNVDKNLLIKRVIGMAGDKIKIENGVVYRNGEMLVEDYVKNKDTVSMNEIIVPENEIFVLGDNRESSYDARYWEKKTISLKDVVGEVKRKVVQR